jgi:transposase
MLNYMDRSTIYYLKQKGWTNTQIAAFVGHHRDTIARVLREPVDRAPAPRARASVVAVFDAQLQDWLDRRLPVRRMLELAQADPDHPYTGSAAAFYKYVQPLRAARRALPGDVAVRFEGLPGELLQIDWGEARQFPFGAPGLAGQPRYFFAARLKYSRWMFVRFTADMREETLLRCLVACFLALGGVPWVVTSDNMKTVTLGRDERHQPLWHPAYQKFAAEFTFHPAVCAPGAANQKGAVENLVKFVRSNFLAGRTFRDDADLARECDDWLRRVNEARPSGATGQPPAALLAVERPRLGPLPAAAHDYGVFDSVLVSHEALVTIATNRYSVPAHLVGQALTARLHPERIELYAGTERVASHPRQHGRHARVVVPEHYEAVFALKPRARAMVYRDWLVGLSTAVAEYVALLCRRRYGEMEPQLCALYDLAQQLDRLAFLRAVEHALAHGAIGAEYVRALAAPPAPPPRALPTPSQREVERDLADYERYVANRAAVAGAAGGA